MTPHVAARGSSFVGAGQYYLHDKNADTQDRVGWVHTRNVPTHDPEKALKWMAYTACNAEKIKQEYGTSKVGRKSDGKPVYSYSLSWHEADKPSREEMEKAANQTIDKLGLNHHEAIIVAHRDTKHPHVHVVCNLVDPNTGKTKSMSCDRLVLSKWAMDHDKAHGRDHCPERIKNQQKREDEKKFIKHRSKEDPRAKEIRGLYEQSDGGKAFQAALKEEGYELTQGNKGRITLVDHNGQIFALSRQLKGQRAKDIKAKLNDIDFKELRKAKDVSEERQHFDRDQYNAEWEEKVFQAGIDHDKAKQQETRHKTDRKDEASEKKKNIAVREEYNKHAQGEEKGKQEEANKRDISQENQDGVTHSYDTSHLNRIDRQWAYGSYATNKRAELEEMLHDQYGREDMVKKLEKLDKALESHSGIWSRLTGKTKSLQEEREVLQKNLDHVDMRIAEYRGALEKELEKKRDEMFPEDRDQPKLKEGDLSDEFDHQVQNPDHRTEIEARREYLKTYYASRKKSKGYDRER